MILKSKICGVSDSKTLNYIVNHKDPPQFIGFIANYPKSKRFVNLEKLKKLIKINKLKSFYVAVLVDPEENILEYCQIHKRNALDEFKYYKGKIFSRNNKNALTPDEEKKAVEEMLKKMNKKKK